MCLSTVIQIVDGEPHEVAQQVSDAKVGDGEVIFADILGQKMSVKGTITHVDLMDNKIYVTA